MPLTSKGKKIRAAMHEEYGDKKGESVFYASINKGKIKGAEQGGKVMGYGGKISKQQMAMYQQEAMRGQGAAVAGGGQGYGGKVMGHSGHVSMGMGGKVMSAGGVSTAPIKSGDGHPMHHAESCRSRRQQT